MNKLAELQQERASKIEAQKTLIETRKASTDGNFTEEQTRSFNDLQKEIENLEARISTEESVVAAEKRAASLAGNSVSKSGGEDKEKRAIKKAASVSAALRAVVKGQPLTGAEKEMNELAIEENRAAGVETPDNSLLNIPMSMLRATAQTVSEDAAAYGGALVHDNAPRVQEKFAPKTILESLGATVWRGLSGGNIPLPVNADYDFTWLGETDAIVPQKKTIAGPSLSPKRLGAAVEISNRLLAQASNDVEGMIRARLGAGYDRAINIAAINGSGTGNEPTGILNTAGVQQSTVVAPAAPTRAMMVELPALIEAANSSTNSLGFLMSPQLKALLQDTKTDAGSGLFLMQQNNELIGYKVESSTLVPELGGNKVMIFGDFSQLFVGEWGALSVLTDPYSASLSNSVRLVLNGHADVAIAQADAFAVNKFIS